MKETQNKNNKKALKFHAFRSRSLESLSSSSPSPLPLPPNLSPIPISDFSPFLSPGSSFFRDFSHFFPPEIIAKNVGFWCKKILQVFFFFFSSLIFPFLLDLSGFSLGFFFSSALFLFLFFHQDFFFNFFTAVRFFEFLAL